MPEATIETPAGTPVVTPEGAILGRLDDIEKRLKSFEDSLFEKRVVAIVKDALKHPFTFPRTVKQRVAKNKA